MHRCGSFAIAAAVTAILFCFHCPSGAQPQNRMRGPVYRSPFDLAFSPHGSLLAVSDHTAGRLVLIDVNAGRVAKEVELEGRPTGVAWAADGRFVYVAECNAGTVAEVDRGGKLTRRLAVGPRPIGLALAPRRGWLLAANSATDTVSVVELASARQIARLAVPRTPYFLTVSPDEKLAVVGNRLPGGKATDPATSAAVTLIDLESKSTAAHVTLPPNSVNVHGVAISPDGKWAYLAHNLARTGLPTEQIEYGWINANGLSIIDLRAKKRFATILLDQITRGAANPWGVAVAADGATLWVTLAGVHQLARLDLAKLDKVLAENLSDIYAAKPDNGSSDRDVRPAIVYTDPAQSTATDPTAVEVVISELPLVYGQGVYLGGMCFRTDLPGNGPRGLAVSPHGKRLAVAAYFSGNVLLVDARTSEVARVVALPNQAEPERARRGEMIFHDATRCYQQWLSCVTCHPDGRADGLNWDLLNDGIGSPKNTKSLLLSHQTPPVMSRGVRPNMEAAAEAGFKHILFQKPGAGDLPAVVAYLRAMRPDDSPYLVGGRLCEKARRGKAIFESPGTRCSRCHRGPLYTDLRMHNVGTRGADDRGDTFDTPTLIELWRTAPYLHDGRAATLHDVIASDNKDNRHGTTSHLTGEQIDALVEYLRSL